MLFFCLIEGAGSLPWTGGSAAKPGKPKGKKKLSSVRQKFDVGCSSVNLGNDWFKNCCDGTGFSFFNEYYNSGRKVEKRWREKGVIWGGKDVIEFEIGTQSLKPSLPECLNFYASGLLLHNY